MTPEEKIQFENDSTKMAESIKGTVYECIKKNNMRLDSIEVSEMLPSFPFRVVVMAIEMLDKEKKIMWDGNGLSVVE